MPDTIDQNQQTTPADTYRWPQKVKRYGLNTHPFLRLFVALFENTVPWNKHPKGWDANLLNEYIRETLLPALKPTDCVGESNAPFSDKYYLKNIALEAALQADEHAELVALRSRVSSDPEGVKSKVLHFFNKRKQRRFTKWWDFMNREYSDEPAWIYCVLKSVFDECGRGVRRTPDRVEPDAMRNLAAAVQQGKFVPGVGIANRYVIERMSHLTGTDRYLHNGWTRIPGISTNCPSADGVRQLSFLGRKAGWCVASEGTGRMYLGTCDFFVMCDRDKPVVGARIGKDTIYEAAGYRNGEQPFTRDIEVLRRVVFPYQSWAIRNRSRASFSSSRTQPWSDGQWRDVLIRFPFGWDEAPEHIRNDVALKNEVLAALIRQSAMDPFWLPYVPTEFVGRPEFAQLVKDSWKEHLMSRPVPLSKIPVQFLNDPDIVDAWQFGWEYYADSIALEADKIPEQILRSDTFTAHWAKGWERTFNGSIPGNITTWWQRTPHELRELPSIKEALINGWEAELRRSSRCWGNVPHELRALPNFRQLWINGWEAQLRDHPKTWVSIPAELREMPLFKQLLINGWEAELRRSPESSQHIPSELLELPSIQEALNDPRKKSSEDAAASVQHETRLMDGCRHPLPSQIQDPRTLRILELMSSTDQVDQLLESWATLKSSGSRSPKSLILGMSDEELPPALAANAEIRKARERYWRGIVKEDPRAFPRVPESLRSDAKVLANLRAALGPEIRSNPMIWETLHEVIRADECLQRVHRIATRGNLDLAA